MRADNSAWLDTGLFPFQSRYAIIGVKKLHYVDEGQGPAIVFVHGTPTWSFVFRRLIQRLSRSYRCIALDHVGFGLSEKPLEPISRFQPHVENLGILLERLGVKEHSLVLHDLGGPIGLAHAIAHTSQVQALVLMNTFAWNPQGEPAYERALKLLQSPWLPFLYKRFNFSARFLLPAAFANRKRLTTHLHSHYLKPFAKPADRLGPLGFAQALANDTAWLGQLWGKIAGLKELPVLLAWGEQDAFFTLEAMERFHQALPLSYAVTFTKAGHFLPEEAPDELSSAVEGFLYAVHHRERQAQPMLSQ